jgi:hypothetical protein
MEKLLLILSHVNPGTYHDKTGECPICKANYLGQMEYEPARQKNQLALFPDFAPFENELESTKDTKLKGLFTDPGLNSAVAKQVGILEASLHLVKLSVRDIVQVYRTTGFSIEVSLFVLQAEAENLLGEKDEVAKTVAKRMAWIEKILARSRRAVFLVYGPLDNSVFATCKSMVHGFDHILACGFLFPDTRLILRCLNTVKKLNGRCNFFQLQQSGPISHFAFRGARSQGHLNLPLFI